MQYLSDEAMSGELHSRPGIDEAKQGIEERRWDLIVCEDSSRLYRVVNYCLDFVARVVDADVRLICLNDDVDTAEADWNDRLQDAASQHQRANTTTRKRIARAIDARWDLGAAVGPLRPGMIRKRKSTSASSFDDDGLAFDEADPKWAHVVAEAFQRIADGQRAWEVGKWLREQGLPGANGRPSRWLEGQVLCLIRTPDYRGLERYRQTITKKYHRTGKKRIERAKADQVLERFVPAKRMVDDDLWYRANAVIDARRRRQETPHGKDHPLHGIPRDSRGPLAELFVCGICGEKMYADGRNEGGYRCSAARARSERHRCWNKTTALRDLTHAKIAKAMAALLLVKLT